MTTLERFLGTKRRVEDLTTVVDDDGVIGSGLVYCENLYIMDTTTWPTTCPGYGRGRWYTVIGNMEYQSDDLTKIETVLCDFAVRSSGQMEK